MADRLFVTSNPQAQGTLNRSLFGGGGSVVGAGSGGRGWRWQSVVRDYSIETLSTGFVFAQSCVTACERKVKEDTG